MLGWTLFQYVIQNSWTPIQEVSLTKTEHIVHSYAAIKGEFTSMLCCAVQCCAVLCNAVQCCFVLWSAVQ